MVVDRQKDHNLILKEAWRYRVAGRLKGRAGRMIRQAGSESGQARVKTGRTRKMAIRKKQ